MGCTIVTSREFNQDVSKANRDALKGPVFITERGHTAHVLLSVEDYQKMTDKDKSIAELLAMPEAGSIDFEIPRGDFSSLSVEILNPWE
ncbi:MAG: type II toxin-antitoxin system Phd/YefM family antitoxin [Gammaproteobacteria bacterium]|nr:type II toxin-antitoxin system Phd/YefM family antitoxin [Gammaproteobacteria bacterium]MDE0156576.1 type II toxin-antitoxin system Phd/YefM family antitoxin [Gammaproteobacteria bacterium]MDE0285034.1 type II toxin-antitoxin system Phd/YefM family antitoxin [Gammaproteobacteria bacterium]MDE0514280.1 type II toxin-antitoxin system Phd/YefM family antitoxin [Gammaproteobacteria bacterium]